VSVQIFQMPRWSQKCRQFTGREMAVQDEGGEGSGGGRESLWTAVQLWSLQERQKEERVSGKCPRTYNPKKISASPRGGCRTRIPPQKSVALGRNGQAPVPVLYAALAIPSQERVSQP
jgi:hypothetical protein